MELLKMLIIISQCNWVCYHSIWCILHIIKLYLEKVKGFTRWPRAPMLQRSFRNLLIQDTVIMPTVKARLVACLVCSRQEEKEPGESKSCVASVYNSTSEITIPWPDLNAAAAGNWWTVLPCAKLHVSITSNRRVNTCHLCTLTW